MQHYVGLDVSLKQTAVCVVDQAGKIRREGMVTSEPKAIADFIAASAPQVMRIGFESGATSTWLWTELKKLGLPVICIDARHAKARIEDADQQERPQRCRRHRPHHAVRLVQGGARQRSSTVTRSRHSSSAELCLSRSSGISRTRSAGLLKNLGLVIGRAR